MSSSISRKKLVICSVVFVGLLFVIGISIRHKQRPEKPVALYPHELGSSFPCPGKAEVVTVSDSYLPGKIEPGQSVKIFWNWYACHPPKVGEIALVRVSRNLAPKAKVIRAIPGDSIAVMQDSPTDRWNLWVNDQAILDYQNVKYAFGGKTLPPIGRYIQARGSVLGPRDVVVLSTRSPGELDSGIFGVVGVDDLVGKIELE